MQELYSVNPTDLNIGQSVYDTQEHIPFPTLDYIKLETGIDVTEGSGDSVKATALVRFISKTAMGYIKELVIPETREKIEFLIAKSTEHRKAFVDFVCAVVVHAIVLVVYNGVPLLLSLLWLCVVFNGCVALLFLIVTVL